MVEEGTVPDPRPTAPTAEPGPPVAPAPAGVVALVRLASLVVDPDGVIAHWNRPAEELFGHRSDTVFGRSASGLLPVHETRPGALSPGRDIDALALLEERVSADGCWAGGLPVADREDRVRDVLWWAYRVAEPSGPGLLVFAADARPLRGGPRLALGSRLLPYAAVPPQGGPLRIAADLCAPEVHRAPGMRSRLASVLPRTGEERRERLLRQIGTAGAPALRVDGSAPVPVLPYEPPEAAGQRIAAGVGRRYPTAQQRAARAVRALPQDRRPSPVVTPGQQASDRALPGQAAVGQAAAPGQAVAGSPGRTAGSQARAGQALAGRALPDQAAASGGPAAPGVSGPGASGPRPSAGGPIGVRMVVPTGHAALPGPRDTAPPSGAGGAAPGAAGPARGAAHLLPLLHTGPGGEQFALLNEAGAEVGTTLDLDTTARELCEALVPRTADFACVDLLDGLISDGELPEELPDDRTTLRRVAVVHNEEAGRWDHVLVEGSLLAMPRSTPPGLALQSNQPVLVPVFDADLAAEYAAALGSPGLVPLVSGRSMLVLPLAARGTVLGILKLLRLPDRAAFDENDAATLRELAARAALSLDNARLHRAESKVATTLQRSMIPTRPPRIPGVLVAHRYMPGNRRAQVGGDWFDAVQLPGSRVALVVGDVMGHGLHSAAAMGRFRTAVQTLAALDLPPGQLLRHLDNLAHRLGDDHLATCLYAVYDPINRTCTLANAGHVPPVLVHPDGRSELLELPEGAPIGVGGVPFVAKEIKVEDGSMLVLCTDGLVEVRGGDIGDGLAALCGNLIDPRRTPEEACDTVLARLHSDDRKDDVALLVARFDGVAPQDVVTWRLRVDLAEVARARTLVRDQLAAWRLDGLADTAQLLVSELVTNALRVARDSVQLQLIQVDKLLVEVSDDDHNLPSLEPSGHLDEDGRGLSLVSQLSSRWGTARKAVGKVVWFELPLPHRP
ncbi:SpoIIE family protein phosphatase [Streptomyces sp. NPDC001380]|uniref:SpoIIE family protein phosphatase n=1 Tax=Streptomyces sp. NPDC001380 TaxID=3364566 RepID=UPI0036CE64AC